MDRFHSRFNARLSGNLIQLVFFGTDEPLLFLLIGCWHQNAQAQDGARM
jgi:NADH:ubiquinone oxidoreductase subunit 5 (subunit L)/multisubunit Na+/H+ antiporter MnhA subunit